MAKRWSILLLLLSITMLSYGQSRKQRKNKSSKPPIEQPSALNPGESERVYAPKKASGKPSKGATYNAEREFYERMEELEKTKRKNEKLSMKPQYSDPMYFGHKKPPKKRKPGKMRYCKECGIRH
jgi:hypothetical protein